MSLPNQTGVIGVTNDAASNSALFPLGTTVVMNSTDYIYAQAASALAAAATTNLTGAFATTAGSTYTHDVVAPGVLINQYFWAKKAVSPF